ncbi:unnamed protein product [Caenorhabditis brenneri]
MNAVTSNTIQAVGADGDTGSLKRPLQSENLDEDLIPAKKASEVGDLNMDDELNIIDIYPVPEKMVGLVIGKGGTEIRLIQQTSACRVQMDADDQSNDGIRNCTIEGTPDQVAIAKQMITQVINRNQGIVPTESTDDEVTEDILIPSDKIGLVIGKGGETIRTVQEQSGLRTCNVVQDSTSATGQPKPLRMSGTPTAVETAKALVTNIMNNIQGNISMLQKSLHSDAYPARGEVIVPRLSAGMIIGKGGEMIKRLAQETGTKIQFKPDSDPNSEDRIAVIVGSREQIYRATERITEIVNKAIKNNGVNPNGQQTFYLHVPASKCGLVIGKGGENIKQIERDTGATCGLAGPAEQKNDDEKVFEIKGTQFQIHHAAHLVKIKVGEIAPNTPVPPMTTSQYQTAQQQQVALGQNDYSAMGQYMHPQQHQQAQQYGYAQQAWNPQSGGSVQQQQHVTATMYTNSVPQAQVTGTPVIMPADGAPTVNPTTGAPDYSAQWAAYYRSIGLNEQAAMVETQMRRNQAAAGSAGDMGSQSHQQYYSQ